MSPPLKGQASESTEATPEMIKAGVAEWSSWDERFESPQEMIERVYRAMAVKAEVPCDAAGVGSLDL